jgi:galactonate dehydratase
MRRRGAPPEQGLPAAAATSAFDQALIDLAARRAGTTVAETLGVKRAGDVVLYANINRRTLDRSPQGFAASARDARALGFGAYKIAPFDGVSPANASTAYGRGLIAAGLARAAAVREAIGPEARLLIDCHWRLTPQAAIEVLDEASGLRLHWLECALPETAENLAAMRRIRDRANRDGVLTAGCETMSGVEGFAPFLVSGVYDAIMPDVKYAGGMREILRIAERAAAAGVACSLHNPSGPVCHAHSIQASAAIGGTAMLEHQFDESPLFARLVARTPERFVAARVPWRGGPGIGIDLDRAVMLAHREAWPP